MDPLLEEEVDEDLALLVEGISSEKGLGLLLLLLIVDDLFNSLDGEPLGLTEEEEEEYVACPKESGENIVKE